MTIVVIRGVRGWTQVKLVRSKCDQLEFDEKPSNDD